MATAINQAVPLVALPLGTRNFGPFALNGHTAAVLTLDRTVANGLEATPAAAIDITITITLAGGQTASVAAHIPGGTVLAKDDQGAFTVHVTAADLEVSFPPTATSVSASVAVSGAPVAVSGSISVT